MIAEHIEKRDRSFQATLGCLAATEVGVVLNHMVTAPYWQGMPELISVFAMLGAIVLFLWACRHYLLAKGYGEGWIFLSLFTALSLFIPVVLVASSSAALYTASSLLWHCLPVISFLAGVLPLTLLPDRSKKVSAA